MRTTKCFRPLTGTLLSKTKISMEGSKEHGSFRPLTGTLLSKKEAIELVKQWLIGFRPLTGTLLSKTHPPILPPQAAFTAGLRGK